MNKIVSIILTLGIVVALVIVFTSGDNRTNNGLDDSFNSNNVVMKDGVQYITINAKGGYSPRQTVAKAGIPTKIVMTTNNTYDCSSYLVIKSLNYQNFLSQNGETEIDLGNPQANTTLRGLCSMGMYSFDIKFE